MKEDIIWDDIKTYLKVRTSSSRQSTSNTPSSLAKKSRQDIINHQIWALLWYVEQTDQKLFKILEEKLKAVLGEERYGMTQSVLERDKSDLIFQAEIAYQDKAIAGEAETLLINLELELMRTLFAETMEQLSQAEKREKEEKNKQESKRLLALCHDYTRTINELKSRLSI